MLNNKLVAECTQLNTKLVGKLSLPEKIETGGAKMLA